LFFAEVSTKHPPRFSLQAQFKASQAFVLVCSITDEHSFLEVKNLWEQIKKVRPNILDVPCVIVGNNLEEENVRQVETFESHGWEWNTPCCV
jgi:GTPase SAR1 family protein